MQALTCGPSSPPPSPATKARTPLDKCGGRARDPHAQQSHMSVSWDEARPHLEAARRNLASVFFVGIVELYAESLCVFGYLTSRLRVGHGVLPAGCSCDEPPSPAGKKKPAHHEPEGAKDGHHLTIKTSHTHNMHMDTTHPVELSRTMREQIEALVEVDVALYREALLRLLDLIDAVQNETSTPILCAGRLEKVQRETSYIRGLWDGPVSDHLVRHEE